MPTGARSVRLVQCFAGRLATMTGRTKRLPVVPIPKQFLAAAMRGNVIDLAGRCDQPKRFTVFAERVALKERFAFAPLRSRVCAAIAAHPLAACLPCVPHTASSLPLRIHHSLERNRVYGSWTTFGDLRAGPTGSRYIPSMADFGFTAFPQIKKRPTIF